jgi:hypothetical protein
MAKRLERYRLEGYDRTGGAMADEIIRILSMDGGGIRGIIPARILHGSRKEPRKVRAVSSTWPPAQRLVRSWVASYGRRGRDRGLREQTLKMHMIE